MDIVVWLRSLGLDEYEKVFRENKVDSSINEIFSAGEVRGDQLLI